MTTFRVLDLYCREGGSSAGYARAGAHLDGVDILPWKRYPYRYHQEDAIKFLTRHGTELRRYFHFIHASPPCQRYSATQRIRGRSHPDLIAPTREALEAVGLPYVIENVEAAAPELINPLMMCGTMFGLRTYRHRLFEFGCDAVRPVLPDHGIHVAPNAKMGRPVKDGEFMHIVGNFSDVPRAREIMGMPWASREGLREAIPPAYTYAIAEAWRTEHLKD